MAIEDPPCYRKYGVPIYGASWYPSRDLPCSHHKPEQVVGTCSDDRAEQEQQQTESSTYSPWLVFCGGGGEGNSGIRNCVLLAHYDQLTKSLSPTPMNRLGTGGDLPYRMAVHPGGEGVLCSFPKSCRWIKWDVLKSTETDWDVLNTTEIHQLDLESSVLSQLEDVGQQLGMAFNHDGSVLAVGGEDGHLRVFKWPSMEVILNQVEENSRIKDLDFSSDGKFLVSLGSRGPCRVWDVSSSKIVASLPKENDMVFGFCRFSQTKDNNQILYITATTGRGGSIICWDSTSWKRISSKQIVPDPISAFNVSSDGKLLAVGTVQGDVYIMNSRLRVQTVIRKAHLGLVTVLAFSEDSRYLVSASMDSSARVTPIGKKKENAAGIWVFVFMVLLAILAYILKSRMTHLEYVFGFPV